MLRTRVGYLTKGDKFKYNGYVLTVSHKMVANHNYVLCADECGIVHTLHVLTVVERV